MDKIKRDKEIKRRHSSNVKKLSPRKPVQYPNEIYITKKSNFKYQLKQCEDLLNSGLTEIYMHCLGNAINRGINLALILINNSSNVLSYAINTSTIFLKDEVLPLCDEEDLTMQRRNNSAIHIKIYRNTEIDIGFALNSIK